MTVPAAGFCLDSVNTAEPPGLADQAFIPDLQKLNLFKFLGGLVS